MLRLHDTALSSVVDITPRTPGRFSMYVCGPTVYDLPHIGHGRTMLVYDVLRVGERWTAPHVANDRQEALLGRRFGPVVGRFPA